MVIHNYLPVEIKNHIAGYIPISEVGMLSSINKNFSEEIPNTQIYQNFLWFRGIYRRGARLYNRCRNSLINFVGYFSDVYNIDRLQ